MDINVYLPDDLGARAKEADLPFSRMLRDAVTRELDRQAAVQEALDGAREYEIEVADEVGTWYTGIFNGKKIADIEDRRSENIQIYLLDDERILVHDGEGHIHEIEDAEEELPQWLQDDPAALIEALKALGLKARVRL